MDREWPPALIPATQPYTLWPRLRVDKCKQRFNWLLWNIRNRRNNHEVVSLQTTDQIECKTCYVKRNDHPDNKNLVFNEIIYKKLENKTFY